MENLRITSLEINESREPCYSNYFTSEGYVERLPL